MKALAWHGKGDIRCEEVPDPKIEHPRDANALRALNEYGATLMTPGAVPSFLRVQGSDGHPGPQVMALQR